MKACIVFLMSCMMIVSSSAQQAKKLHYKAILVDTHNDVLSESVLKGKDISHRLQSGQSDLVRWKEGGVDVQFFSVWTDEKPRTKEGFFKDANEEIDSFDFFTLRNLDKIVPAFTYRDVKRGIRQRKLVGLIGVEGGHMIENDLDNLTALYKRGMRYLTLTWNNSNEWATSARDETLHPGDFPHKGLTAFGKQVIRKMNELGVMVDLSHTGEQTFYDALAVTSKPVLLSHSSVYSLCPVFRNLKDDQIRAVAKNGGVICINFYSAFISKDFAQRAEWLDGPGKSEITDSLMSVYKDAAAAQQAFQDFRTRQLEPLRPTLAQLVDHIDYIVKLVGDDYVGLGSDYDGIDSTPLGMEDVTRYPLITEELLRRGYSKKSVRKILGGNVLRVMKANFH
ncbi:MAG TPA: dipeptidase [Chitinophagaceae bacterium]|jgi:membrane dipeptidase|nr:dipeptidase [Chitinophagaceae bacterium]